MTLALRKNDCFGLGYKSSNYSSIKYCVTLQITNCTSGEHIHFKCSKYCMLQTYYCWETLSGTACTDKIELIQPFDGFIQPYDTVLP